MKPITLEEFMKSLDNAVSGHYAVWTSGMIPITNFKEELNLSGNFAYGFSGAVVEYDEMQGFKGDFPEWFEKTEDYKIKILLLEEMPDNEDFY